MSGLEILGALGAAVSAVGSIAGGNAANKQAKQQSRILEQQAMEEKAAAYREAQRKRKEASVLESRQVAAAAVSGGGVNDPGVLDIIGDTAAEGEVQAQELKYAGDVRANDLSNQAASVRYTGKQEKTAGLIKGVSTIATTGASLYNKLNPPEDTGLYAPGRYLGGGSYTSNLRRPKSMLGYG